MLLLVQNKVRFLENKFWLTLKVIIDHHQASPDTLSRAITVFADNNYVKVHLLKQRSASLP